MIQQFNSCWKKFSKSFSPFFGCTILLFLELALVLFNSQLSQVDRKLTQLKSGDFSVCLVTWIISHTRASTSKRRTAQWGLGEKVDGLFKGRKCQLSLIFSWNFTQISVNSGGMIVLSLTAFSEDLTFLTQFEKSCNLAMGKGRRKKMLEPVIFYTDRRLRK